MQVLKNTSGLNNDQFFKTPKTFTENKKYSKILFFNKKKN